MSLEILIKAFDEPDEVRRFEKGVFELVEVGGRLVGRATYEPGWKWSTHVGPLVGDTRCRVGHFGIVLRGEAAASFEDGTIVRLRAGCVFSIPAVPHDSWVVGDREYTSLHLLGADEYARSG